MVMHLHSARTRLARATGVVALLSFALALAPSTPESKLAPVTGRVTYAGRPVTDMVICFDSEGQHTASGSLKRDGSFELWSFSAGGGTLPGKYGVHLNSSGTHPPIPLRYLDPSTSGLEVGIKSDWNQISFDLF